MTVVEFNLKGQPVRTPAEAFTEIPLKVSLYFESGKRVEDSDQKIFRFVGNDYDSIIIDPVSRQAVIDFRLEKVSRRKDGQRFKLKIEPNRDLCTANISDLEHVFTNAICVLSKRKYNSIVSPASSSPPASKIAKEDMFSMEQRINERINQLDLRLMSVLNTLEALKTLTKDLVHKQSLYEPKRELVSMADELLLNHDFLPEDVQFNFGLPSCNQYE